MAQIIAVANHKGGVGKTASAVNLAALFAEQGTNTLLVDLDPQGNASTWLDAKDNGSALVKALTGDQPLTPEKTAIPNLNIVAGGMPLASAQKSLDVDVGVEFLLNDLLKRSAGTWDMIFLDCPPSLNFLTVNALTACTGVLLPLEAHPLGLRGLNDSRKVVNAVCQRLNPLAKIIAVLPCRAHLRRALHREVIAALEEAFPNHVAPAVRENVAIAEAPAHGLPIHCYSPRSNGCHDYKRVTAWLSARLFREGS
jgi:chromosome partitioning protein